MSSSSHGLSARQSLLVGITLFSMFFGAGNLILPPLLGYQAGVASVPAVAGFLVTGIGLPVFGVMSCALVGDLDQLGGRVHPRFAFVFAILIYLSIGPCLAIPRTASTAYRMLVPVVAETTGAAAEGAFSPLAIAFSVLFFAAAGVLALRPGKLTRLLGKVTGPALIALIVVVVVSAVAAPLSAPQPVQAPYDRVPLLQGFITGYQTMDVLASVTFGIVIAQNIRGLGVSEDAAVAREVMRAGALMGALMALVYCGMAAVGTLLGNAAGQVSNGADVLSASATLHFGLAGTVIVAVIFLLACLLLRRVLQREVPARPLSRVGGWFRGVQLRGLRGRARRHPRVLRAAAERALPRGHRARPHGHAAPLGRPRTSRVGLGRRHRRRGERGHEPARRSGARRVAALRCSSPCRPRL